MDGLATFGSNFGPQETMDRLDAAIKAKGMSVFARINHSELAAGAGLRLRSTEVIIFGNPLAGTPLMRSNQTIGIDLPLKALVWEDDSGKVWLSYNEIQWLAKRHGIQVAEGITNKIDLALRSIAAEATGSISQSAP